MKKIIFILITIICILFLKYLHKSKLNNNLEKRIDKYERTLDNLNFSTYAEFENIKLPASDTLISLVSENRICNLLIKYNYSHNIVNLEVKNWSREH